MTLTTKGRVRDPLNRLYFNGSGLRTDESTENRSEPAARGQDQFWAVRAAGRSQRSQGRADLDSIPPPRRDEMAKLYLSDQVEGGDGEAVSAAEST